MGIANPRPAMRGREERIIRLQLTFHSLRVGEYVAAGFDPTAASLQALRDVRSLGAEFVRLDQQRQRSRQ